MKTQLITKHNQINKTTLNVNKYEKQTNTNTTQRLDKMTQTRFEAQIRNSSQMGPRPKIKKKHSSLEKIRRLHLIF